MKQSQFNYIYKKDEMYIAYNTFSKAIITLSSNELEILQKIASNNTEGINHEFLDELFKQGFIVEDDYDEIAFLRYFHYKTKFSNEQLSLTIAPTLDCNFACPYCYENARKGKMTQFIQDKLLHFIENKLKAGTNKLDITWYGGEPVLYPEIVDYLASGVKNLTEKFSANFSMSLVTNGYLLTKDVIDMFIRNDIFNIQITLDGLAENHNKRRYLRNGQGTFDQIFNNLSLFKGTPIKVNIRMNVDNINRNDYPMLKKMINSIADTKINIYPSAVEKLNERDIRRSELYMSLSDYDEFILSSYTDANLCDEGLEIIDDRRYFCSAELENSYVVDELGNFYKCWDEIGQAGSICFNVVTPDDINYKPIIRYVADDPFANPQCNKCMYLPICFGGCRFQNYKMKQPVCNFNYEVIRAFVETKYLT